MAQTPKSLSTQKDSVSSDTLYPEKKTDLDNNKPAAAEKKLRAKKPKVTAENKKNLNADNTNHDNQNVLSDITESATTLELASSNITIATQSPSNEAISTSNQIEINKLEPIDFDSPVSVQNQDNLAHAIQFEATPEFAGFIVPSGCGNVLKAEREAQGLSLSEVCKTLRLSANQIQAIEQDDFVNLPKQSIVRGFIRNYARLLKIDAEPILKAFQNIVPDEAPLSLSVKATADESVIGAKEMKFTPKIIINILLTIAVLVAISYLYTQFIKPKAQVEDGLSLNAEEIQKNSPDMMALPLPSPITEVPVEAPSANIADASSSNTISAISTDVSSTNVSTEIGVAKETASNNKQNIYSDVNNIQINQPSPPTNIPVTNQTTNTASVANNQATNSFATTNTTSNPNANISPKTNESQLTFKLSGESWISVETPNGKTIFSDLLPTGSNQSLSVKPPFNIIIGNAGVTKVLINNQDYDLTPVTRSNVARVQIK